VWPFWCLHLRNRAGEAPMLSVAIAAILANSRMLDMSAASKAIMPKCGSP